MKRHEDASGLPELALDEIKRVSQSMGNLLWVLFSGGEIYLRQDLVEISKTIYKNNKPAFITYPTNGLQPDVIKKKTEEILDCCRESVIVVKLSMDGLGNAHDALRAMPGSFEKLMQTYEELVPLTETYPNFELGINTVFCSENQYSLNGDTGVIKFVSDMDKVSTHTISMVRGDLKNEQYKKIDLSQYKKTIQRLEEKTGNRKSCNFRFNGGHLKFAQDLLQRRLIYQTMFQNRRTMPCYAGRLNLVLNESGDLYPCELSPHKMGNVRDSDYDIIKILRSKRARQIVEEIKDDGCYCSHECYFATNILFNPMMYPRLIKQYLLCRFQPIGKGKYRF
jgi:radical SAM protein with 4Fe4S-binding SPASM domain